MQSLTRDSSLGQSAGTGKGTGSRLHQLKRLANVALHTSFAKD